MTIELDISAFEAGPQPRELVPEGILRKGDIVSVRLQGSNRTEEFFRNGLDVEIGDLVIVNTASGHEIGRVTGLVRYGWRENTGGRKILRKAATEDHAHNDRRNQRQADFFSIALEEIRELKLDGQMKPVTLDIQYDGAVAKLYFAAEDRVDFRELVRRLGHRYHMRVELRQVGPRDRAKIAGGYGLCGRELCCSSWMDSFPAVSVKHAKNQHLALDQSKITGQCGRLLCCLSYEDEQYKALNRTLPKRGFKFILDGVNYMVVSTNPLLQKVLVEGPDRQQHLLDIESFNAVILKNGVKLVSQPNYLTPEARTEALTRAPGEIFPPEGVTTPADHRTRPPVQDFTDVEDDDLADEHHATARGQKGPVPAHVEFVSPVSGTDAGEDSDEDDDDDKDDAGGRTGDRESAGVRPQGPNRGSGRRRRRRGRGRGPRGPQA